MKTVLVLCTGNSCRSQIAHGFLNTLAEGRAEIYSAGVETHGLNPNAVKCMLEVEIDISNYKSTNITEYAETEFDYVITVCDSAKERCPYFPAKSELIHYNFADPAKVKGTENEIELAFRKVRTEIEEFCKNFVDKKL